MTTTPTRFTIFFCPLLSTISDCLQLSQPEYSVLDQASCKVSIIVKAFDGTTDGVYVRGPSATIGCSFEKAAQLAICDLKKIYDIYVRDVTALRNQDFERCTNLWRLKRQELERLVKGLPKIESIEEFAVPETSHLHVASIDFVHVLNAINNRLPIECSDIEVIEHTPTTFTAWVSFIHHNCDYDCTSMYSDTIESYVTAEQDLAAKLINYLVPIYNLEIIDANCEPTEYDIEALVRQNIKDKCMLLKEAIPLHHKRSKAKVYVNRVISPLTPAKLSVRAKTSCPLHKQNLTNILPLQAPHHPKQNCIRRDSGLIKIVSSNFA